MTNAATTFVDAIRVQLVCPAGNAALYRATDQIIALLLAEQSVKGWGGFTFSSPNPPLIHGYFWHTHAGEPELDTWEPDRNVLISVDIRGQTPESVLAYFVQLRDRIAAIYRAVQQPQAALWITTHPLNILWDGP